VVISFVWRKFGEQGGDPNHNKFWGSQQTMFQSYVTENENCEKLKTFSGWVPRHPKNFKY